MLWRTTALDPDDLAPFSGRSAGVVSIADAMGHLVLGSRRYLAEPAEQLPLTYHVHSRQEELFYVVDRTLHVETPAREYDVGEGEVFAVEPGHPHRAFNPDGADDAVLVLAVGAPSVDDTSPFEAQP